MIITVTINQYKIKLLRAKSYFCMVKFIIEYKLKLQLQILIHETKDKIFK